MKPTFFLAAILAATTLPALAVPVATPVPTHFAAETTVPALPEAKLLNLLNNPEWADVKDGVPVGWWKYQGGFEMALGAGPQGKNAISMTRENDGPGGGISQKVVLNQNTPQTIVVSGQSKAQDVSGKKDYEYALFVDVTYNDDTTKWGVLGAFETGTHDWQQTRFEFAPTKPIKSLMVYALFRGTHAGQVWFSDLAVKQLPIANG